MKIKEITDCIETLAPLSYAEDFDNVGLLVGDAQTKVTGVLVTLDTLEATVDEAIENKCNLIVSFHPIIFSGLKKLNGATYVERVVLKAIKNDIAIYATHTALDNSFDGVNAKICEVLGLTQREILIPQKNTIKKLTTYVPTNALEQVRNHLFEQGAGSIGNYDHCSFTNLGTGTYKGNENSNPTIGEKGKLHTEEEVQLHVTFPKHLEGKIIKALLASHPYEEVAYEVSLLENKNQHIGMGMVAELETPMATEEFLALVKSKMNVSCIKHSAIINSQIKRVAVLGGSGSFATSYAIAKKADVYLSADFKYHDFYKAEGKILLADIGHYESEQFTKNLLVDFLTEKFCNFAIILSNIHTNPIYYS
ncbi:Nif3-like dinuclear metal center hexameric protein [Ochrovirga pacifica]|uniref:Nif3-like dinuclear metal center hexameric protein n=1 Tax=Ochrovirga pacifica TaxID=1042376 RepID=UPI0002557776|nr:Nif3-like dinuclear metal center hexameric protein [Ochrovirga pacifica]